MLNIKDQNLVKEEKGRLTLWLFTLIKVNELLNTARRSDYHLKNNSHLYITSCVSNAKSEKREEGPTKITFEEKDNPLLERFPDQSEMFELVMNYRMLAVIFFQQILDRNSKGGSYMTNNRNKKLLSIMNTSKEKFIKVHDHYDMDMLDNLLKEILNYRNNILSHANAEEFYHLEPGKGMTGLIMHEKKLEKIDFELMQNFVSFFLKELM
jgi:hypothetical protein